MRPKLGGFPLATPFLALALALPAFAYQRASGWCEQGNQTVNVPGNSPSTTKVQRSYGTCTVTVYLAGTLTLATIFSDNNATPKANPFTASSTGQWFFYADNGRFDVNLSGASISPPFTIGDNLFLDPLRPTKFINIDGVRYASQFAGSDCGAQINAAYADLPANGGKIIIESSCSFTTPIVFNTVGKMALLEGYPGASVNLSYTASSGTAVTLDFSNSNGSGTILTMGKGLRDITLTGPGHSTSTIGVQIGLTQGAQGSAIENFEIQSFGTNVKFGNQTWIVNLSHGMIRDGNINVLFPTGTTNSGENIQWDHVTFADAPTITTGQVQLLSGEHKLTNCSFDSSQLVIGSTGSQANGLISLISPHFENPNFVANPGWYDFVVISSHVGNHVSIISPFFNQDSSVVGTQPEYVSIAGGQLYMSDVELFTPVGPITQFILASNAANVSVIGFNDLSGQTARLVAGTSTGYLVQIPGTNTTAITGYNNVIGPGAGTNVGGVLWDVTGSIRATYSASVSGSGQLASSIPTGTPPIVVASSTPIANMQAAPTTYTSGATPILNTHVVWGTSASVAGVATVIFSGVAAFTGAGTYQCTANVISTNSVAISVVQDSGSQVRFIGSGSHPTDGVGFICQGN